MKKYYLNLDENFKIDNNISDEIYHDFFIFGGGELHIKIKSGGILDKTRKIIITNRIKTSNDLMKILLAKDALYRLGFRYFELVIPYLPYARQDRICDDGESFSLKVLSDIINSCEFEKVHTLDNHSDVSTALLNNCVNYPNYMYVFFTLSELENATHNLTLISPDSGANKKINKLATELQIKNIVKCDKKRNLSNGELQGFEVFSDNLNNSDCLIVDDICSRGGTFMGITKALKEKNAGDIYLFVTHYENTANIDLLKESGIKKIYTTNSMNDLNDDFIKQFKINFNL